MLNPQTIVNEVLPAMQRMLGASNVMQEASASQPNMGHFDPNHCVQAAPLVDISASVAPARAITPDMIPGA